MEPKGSLPHSQASATCTYSILQDSQMIMCDSSSCQETELQNAVLSELHLNLSVMNCNAQNQQCLEGCHATATGECY